MDKWRVIGVIYYRCGIHGKRSKPGMSVQSRADPRVKREEFGMMWGTVIERSYFPMTALRGSTLLVYAQRKNLCLRFYTMRCRPYAAVLSWRFESGMPLPRQAILVAVVARDPTLIVARAEALCRRNHEPDGNRTTRSSGSADPGISLGYDG